MKKAGLAVGFGREAVLAGLIVSLLLSGVAQELGSETLVMTATYPSPIGIYARIITTGGSAGTPLHTILSRNASSVVIGANGPNAGAKFDVEGSGYVLLNSGNVGIGTTAPGSTLSVNGNVTIGSGYAATGAPLNGAIIQGNVGIGTATPMAKLEVAGNIIASDPTAGNHVATMQWVQNYVSALSGGGATTFRVVDVLQGGGYPACPLVTNATLRGAQGWSDAGGFSGMVVAPNCNSIYVVNPAGRCMCYYGSN